MAEEEVAEVEEEAEDLVRYFRTAIQRRRRNRLDRKHPHFQARQAHRHRHVAAGRRPRVVVGGKDKRQPCVNDRAAWRVWDAQEMAAPGQGHRIRRRTCAAFGPFDSLDKALDGFASAHLQMVHAKRILIHA